MRLLHSLGTASVQRPGMWRPRDRVGGGRVRMCGSKARVWRSRTSWQGTLFLFTSGNVASQCNLNTWAPGCECCLLSTCRCQYTHLQAHRCYLRTADLSYCHDIMSFPRGTQGQEAAVNLRQMPGPTASPFAGAGVCQVSAETHGMFHLHS